MGQENKLGISMVSLSGHVLADSVTEEQMREAGLFDGVRFMGECSRKGNPDELFKFAETLRSSFIAKKMFDSATNSTDQLVTFIVNAFQNKRLTDEMINQFIVEHATLEKAK